MGTRIQQRFSAMLSSFLDEGAQEELERIPAHRGRYSTSTPRAPGALAPTPPSSDKVGESGPLKHQRKTQELYSDTHSNDIFETCKSPRSYTSGATPSSASAMSPEPLSHRSSVHKRTPTRPPSRRFSTGMPASSTCNRTQQSSRTTPHTKPYPPSGPASGNITPRGHRWLGPMPEGPPTSILQARPNSGQQSSRGTSIGAMRSRRYIPSASPPPSRTNVQHTTPTPPKSRTPSNLPLPPSRRSNSVTAAARTNSQLTPRDNQSSGSRPHHTSPTVSSSSIIRHKSSTPVRVTKDAQLSRQRERQSSITQVSPRQRTAAAGLSRYESPLRRRATTTPSPSSKHSVPLNTSPRTHDPVPPINSAMLPKVPESRAHTDSVVVTTPRQLTAAPAEVSAAMTDTVGVSSALSVSVVNTPGSKSRHIGEKAAGQLTAERPESSENEFLEGYEMGPVIGEGGFCKVKRGKHRAAQQHVAIKVINKKALKDKHDWRRVGREIRILKRLKNHPAIIHMYDVISMPSEVYVIQELAQGGSLLDYIRDRKRVSENLAIRFFLQVVAGLQYCHDREVVHRDIKLENLLMDSDRNMKIIDFGLAAIFTEGKALKVHCGSPSYAAPEIIGRRSYSGPPVDVWSLGIVTFAMVCGHLPFYSRNGRSDLSRKIMAGKYTAPDYMSDSMKDIVAGMLTLDPSQRLTLPQLYTHRWVTGSLASRSLTLPRALLHLNEATNSYDYDTDILDHMERLGVDRDCVTADLAVGECNQITATYFLFAESMREGKGVPPISKSSRHLGSSLVCRSRAAQSVHGFSLDIEDSGDRDDQAHFAPSRSRRQAAEQSV